MDLSTSYLGISLKNPIVPSASPLSRDLDKAKALEDRGAAALVMNSLFEEEIENEASSMDFLIQGQSLGHGEADSYLPMHGEYQSCLEKYLEQLVSLKTCLDIPVIASLNGVTDGGWTDYAKDLEAAGADALELNIYYIPVDISESADTVEARHIRILQAVKQQVGIPVTCKIGMHFSSPGHFIKQLEAAGANGVSLFNRFYQPDINTETLNIDSSLKLSDPDECLLRMHWIAIVRDHVNLSLAATGGIHDAQSVAKLLLAGADVTHMCSALLKHGPDHVAVVIEELTRWMEEHEYESVSQLKGSVSKKTAINPIAYERLNYMEMLQSY
jgi:dihydroorotate dehydrogenase (fumarate)